jgi:hypothetical protein
MELDAGEEIWIYRDEAKYSSTKTTTKNSKDTTIKPKYTRYVYIVSASYETKPTDVSVMLP